MKICPVVAQFFYAEGRKERPTDRQTEGQSHRHDEINSHFLQFYKCA